MDFLLIVLAIGGFVVAIVLLVLASRANRLHAESEERVDTLEALATGSVLFASSSPAVEPMRPEEDNADFALNEFADENDLIADHATREEPPALAPATFTATARVLPFVTTVSTAAGAGRVQVSFDRARSRSRG